VGLDSPSLHLPITTVNVCPGSVPAPSLPLPYLPCLRTWLRTRWTETVRSRSLKSSCLIPSKSPVSRRGHPSHQSLPYLRVHILYLQIETRYLILRARSYPSSSLDILYSFKPPLISGRCSSSCTGLDAWEPLMRHAYVAGR